MEKHGGSRRTAVRGLLLGRPFRPGRRPHKTRGRQPGLGFGGNGTPIGSIVGVVGLSMSEQTRTPIDFKTWLKTATVVMLVTVAFVSLLITVI